MYPLVFRQPPTRPTGFRLQRRTGRRPRRQNFTYNTTLSARRDSPAAKKLPKQRFDRMLGTLEGTDVNGAECLQSVLTLLKLWTNFRRVQRLKGLERTVSEFTLSHTSTVCQISSRQPSGLFSSKSTNQLLNRTLSFWL